MSRYYRKLGHNSIFVSYPYCSRSFFGHHSAVLSGGAFFAARISGAMRSIPHQVSMVNNLVMKQNLLSIIPSDSVPWDAVRAHPEMEASASYVLQCDTPPCCSPPYPASLLSPFIVTIQVIDSTVSYWTPSPSQVSTRYIIPCHAMAWRLILRGSSLFVRPTRFQ